MAYVITDACSDCKDTACVPVCPADCIHPTPDAPDFEDAHQLYIDPGHCIHCSLCVMECPVDAIFADDDLEGDDRKFIEINRAHFHKQDTTPAG